MLYDACTFICHAMYIMIACPDYVYETLISHVHVNHDRYVEDMYTYLIGMLCHENDESMIYITSMYCNLKLWDHMHIVCYEH